MSRRSRSSPVQAWNKLTSRALRFAIELSPDVRAVHVLTQDSTICELSPFSGRSSSPARPMPPVGGHRRGSSSSGPPSVQFFAPLIQYVEALRAEHPERDIVVIVPDLVVRHWYQAILHNNRGMVLKGILRLRGGPRVVVVNTPFYLAE